jgi:hypothetical protein
MTACKVVSVVKAGRVAAQPSEPIQIAGLSCSSRVGRQPITARVEAHGALTPVHAGVKVVLGRRTTTSSLTVRRSSVIDGRRVAPNNGAKPRAS